MKIEELETLWSAQQPTPAASAEAAEFARRLAPELRRHSRFFAYAFFCFGFGLAVRPLLAVVNYLHAVPPNPVLYWFNAGLYVVVMLVVLAFVRRRWRSHRELVESRVDTMAAATAKALASVEAEARDCRLAARSSLLWFGLTLLAIYTNNPIPLRGWEPFLLRAAMSVAFFVLIGAVIWRHYRVNLVPELARRKQLLAELS